MRCHFYTLPRCITVWSQTCPRRSWTLQPETSASSRRWASFPLLKGLVTRFFEDDCLYKIKELHTDRLLGLKRFFKKCACVDFLKHEVRLKLAKILSLTRIPGIIFFSYSLLKQRPKITMLTFFFNRCFFWAAHQPQKYDFIDSKQCPAKILVTDFLTSAEQINWSS